MASVEVILVIGSARYSIPVPYDADFPLAITRSIVDYEDVGKRKGDYTKTIKVQANQEVNNVLRNLFLSTIAQNEAKVLKLKGDTINVPCEIVVNGLTHTKGYCLVKSASSTGKPNYYELTIFSAMNDWADKLAKTKLREIDLGRYFFSWAEIKDSSSQGMASPGGWTHCYPLIDYGDIGNKPSAGYAIMDYELRSAPYIYDMVNAMFSLTGYTIYSDWLDNDDIKRLIYPFTSGNWKRSIFTEYDCKTKWSSQQTLISGSGNYILASDTDVSDTQNQSTFAVSQTIIPPPIFGSTPLTFTGTLYTSAEGGTKTIVIDATLTGNSSTNNIVEFWLHKGTPNKVSHLHLGSATIIGTTPVQVDILVPTYIESGEEYCICAWPINNTIVNVAANSKLEFLASEDIEIGSEYDVANTLPDKSCMEFIQGLSQLFNLVFDTDPLARTIKIEPMFSWLDSTGTTNNGYYLGFNDAVDFSNKVQQHFEFKTEFLSNYKQQLFFKYKDDSSDGILAIRKTKTGHTYGGYKHGLYKRFQQGTQELTNSHFAATYMGYRDIGGAGSYIQSLLVPMIMETFTSGYDQPTYKCEPRILYFKYSDHDSFFPGSTGSYHYEWQLKDSIYGNIHTFSTNAPRAFSVDCDAEVDFSLNFDNMETPLHTEAIGLFQRFWAKVPPMINEGVKATGMFKYLEIDNLNLSFRKLWYVNDVYWIVNKIVDYKPQEVGFTKVELLLKSELGRAANQDQPDGNDGWANPSGADTSGEVLDFAPTQEQGIFTDDGNEIFAEVGNTTGTSLVGVSTKSPVKFKKLL